MATEARDRIAARDRVEARRRQVDAPSTLRDDSDDEMIVSFPEFVFKEFIAMVAMTVFLVVVSIFLQAPLLGQANPGVTPNPSKAPWYFLGLQELLSRFPPLMAGVAFPTFVIVLMILVPFLDRNPSRRPSERKVAIILFALYMAIVVALVIIGTFFRGHEFIWNWSWVLGNPQTCGGEIVLGRVFLVVSVGFMLLLGYAFYQDFNRPWLPIQQAYAQKYGADFPIQVQQLFPRVQVNNQFVVERCITCHVPDVQKIGPQEAANRLGPNHPSVINDAVFAKYGQDTLICRPVAAASAAPSASAKPTTSAKPSASAAPSSSSAPGAATSPAPSASPSPSASPAAATAASCFDPRAQPYYVLDANGKVVNDPTTNKPITAQLTGFIPNAYKGLGIDESGCIICHNGNRQATSEAGAHQNLVPNPFAVADKAPQLYENNCAQCHGALGEGGKGPPLNDQNRLGFFSDDYYYRCIYLGNTGEEHLGTIMPPWGAKKLLPAPINDNINLLVHWIRMWQQYASLP